MLCSEITLPKTGYAEPARLPDDWPGWVPQGARHYLDHVETGKPIRALAREADVHASTVLRQVRRFEARRSDPLVDAALRDLAVAVSARHRNISEDAAMTSDHTTISEARIMRDGITILRHLSQPTALLAVAEGMETAVVVTEDDGGRTQRNATVERALAQALALKDWISSDNPTGKIARYRITPKGRAQLRELMAAQENSAQGFAEGQARFDAFSAVETTRSAIPESPLCGLSRRRDRDGQPFLSRDLVEAGERLREDFELAQMEPRVTQDWSAFMTAGVQTTRRGGSGGGPSDARTRVSAALADLGPGLGDVALLCCCKLEGMEKIEKRLGWSARSGKIVLRIALEQLKRFYDSRGSDDSLIG